MFAYSPEETSAALPPQPPPPLHLLRVLPPTAFACHACMIASVHTKAVGQTFARRCCCGLCSWGRCSCADGSGPLGVLTLAAHASCKPIPVVQADWRSQTEDWKPGWSRGLLGAPQVVDRSAAGGGAAAMSSSVLAAAVQLVGRAAAAGGASQALPEVLHPAASALESLASVRHLHPVRPSPHPPSPFHTHTHGRTCTHTPSMFVRTPAPAPSLFRGGSLDMYLGTGSFGIGS